jgi:hypothetical protein
VNFPVDGLALKRKGYLGIKKKLQKVEVWIKFESGHGVFLQESCDTEVFHIFSEDPNPTFLIRMNITKNCLQGKPLYDINMLSVVFSKIGTRLVTLNRKANGKGHMKGRSFSI